MDSLLMMEQAGRIRELEAALDAERRKHLQETLPGMDAGGRITGVGVMFAKIRGRYIESRKYSNAWCYARAVGAEDDKPTGSHRTKASQLMANPIIQGYVALERARQGEELRLDTNGILADVIEIKDRAMARLPVPVSDVDSDTGIESLKYRYEFNPSAALKAAEMLGKHIGLWANNDKKDSHDDWVEQMQKTGVEQ